MTTTTRSPNAVWHAPKITKQMREQAAGHRGCIVWFTGLPAAGKSTVANVVDELLFKRGCRSYVLDGDNVRHGLTSDLGFTAEAREENIRRIGEAARLFADAAVIVLAAFISPYRKHRDRVRELMPRGDFFEVFVATPVEVCEQRDPKGYYRRARAGEIAEYTGVSAPYEPPMKPEITLDGAAFGPRELGQQVVDHLEKAGVLSKL